MFKLVESFINNLAAGLLMEDVIEKNTGVFRDNNDSA